MKWIAGISGIMLATIGQAQSFDRGSVDACYSGALPGDTSPSCLGQAANLCQVQGSSTTNGIVQCIQAETAAWDGLLNQVYGEVREVVDARPAGAVNLPEALLTAQRAWIAYRDAECELAYGLWQDGTIRSIVHANCVMQMTARRAIELRDMKGN